MIRPNQNVSVTKKMSEYEIKHKNTAFNHAWRRVLGMIISRSGTNRFSHARQVAQTRSLTCQESGTRTRSLMLCPPRRSTNFSSTLIYGTRHSTLYRHPRKCDNEFQPRCHTGLVSWFPTCSVLCVEPHSLSHPQFAFGRG